MTCQPRGGALRLSDAGRYARRMNRWWRRFGRLNIILSKILQGIVVALFVVLLLVLRIGAVPCFRGNKVGVKNPIELFARILDQYTIERGIGRRRRPQFDLLALGNCRASLLY